MNADDPTVRAAVLASVTDDELRGLLQSSVAARHVAAGVILKPLFAQDKPMYPRAVCNLCSARVPVVVRADDSLAYRTHRVCPAGGAPVSPKWIVGWGTFEHLAPPEWAAQ